MITSLKTDILRSRNFRVFGPDETCSSHLSPQDGSLRFHEVEIAQAQ